MKKLQKPLLIAVLSAALIIVTLQIDPFFAGRHPDQTFRAAAKLLSFIGNDVFLLPAFAALYLIGVFLNKGSIRESGKAGFGSIILSGIAVQVLKMAFQRPRPGFIENPVLTLLEKHPFLDSSGVFSSFPSGHTTITFAAAYVLSKKIPAMRFFFYGIAVFVGASRIYLGSHYPSDVMAGAIVGTAVGSLMACEVHIPDKWKKAGFGLLIVFVCFFKINGFLLFDVDEAVFSEASREMVETGNVITPTYNFEPRYDKPILFYWFMSAAFKILGINEFAARFTSAAFGALLVLMTYVFVKHLKGSLPAFFVSMALLLNIEFFVYSHSAITDMTLTFFITASIYSFYLAMESRNNRWFIAFWTSSALAVLTKGAIGLLFPVSIAFFYLIAVKNLKGIKALLNPAGIILFLIISVPWFTAELYVNGWDFFNAFIIKHHIMRYSGVISSHGGPFYYYIGVLIAGFFPWVSMLPGAVKKAFKERLDPSYGLYVLSSVWFIFILIFFTIARTKLPNYIFPLFPAGAILAGLCVIDIIQRKTERSGLYIMIALSVFIGAGLLALPFINVKAGIEVNHHVFFMLGAIFLLIAAFSVLSFTTPLFSLSTISGLMVTLLIILRLGVVSPINIFMQRTLYRYSDYAARNLGKDGVLATYEINKPSISFYAKRKVRAIYKVDKCDIKEYTKSSGVILITDLAHYNDVKEYNDLRLIDSRDGYMLLGNSAISAQFQ